MLANTPDTSAQTGALGSDVQKPATFRHELVEFIAGQLPSWRDRADRPQTSAEATLTSQLCAHLNGASRHSAGWDILQFRVEEPDERYKGRKIDLVPSPCDTIISVEGRRHTEFDTILPIECKRLPTPAAKDRDEREYVISRYSSTGGIQRFKEGNHGSTHTFAAMIGYIQEETAIFWNIRVAEWIANLAGVEPGWTTQDLLLPDRNDATGRLAVFRSSHRRSNALPEIELRHLWIEMN